MASNINIINKFLKIFLVCRNRFVFNNKRRYFGILLENGCRIGNQMFFIAAGETLRHRYGWNVIYYTPVKKDIIKIDPFVFNKISCYIYTFNFPFQNFIQFEELLDQDKSQQISSALLGRNILCSGNFENIDLIDFQIAKHLFQVPSSIRNTILRLYGDLSYAVSVHVRRGDFVNLHISLSIEYYLNAISYFRKQGATQFIIISDDIDWCRQSFPNNQDLIFADKHKKLSESMYIDLFLPSLCGIGNIISCSTFTWWGAFLNKNSKSKNIMPFPWWGCMPQKNLYLSNSIRLDIHTLQFID